MTKFEARVFDVQRFSIHDGQGIRTVVFFKGCPLKCLWCQNPEGMDFESRPVWMEKECIHCRLCEKAAGNGEVTYTDRPVFNPQCHDFSAVLKACPSGAIREVSRLYTPEEILLLVLKDQAFYGTSEGGVTFSGGEPFMQPDVLHACCRLLQANGIHTAVESSFCADWEKIEPVLESLDQIFMDIKIFDPEKHRAAAGRDNALILENAGKLLSSRHAHKVTIRTPLIPGWTDAEKNIRDIAGFIVSINPSVTYELLPYNILAPAKYKMMEREYPLSADLQKQSADHLSRLKAISEQAGLEHVLCE